ncbi:MAG: hypothetical protein ABIN80_18690 [Dyadobacter sp.]|uniref:hypothetical protein n=1 Tax=Dyadobacter sp. TaxID=1914288 RepID=UPI00326364D8
MSNSLDSFKIVLLDHFNLENQFKKSQYRMGFHERDLSDDEGGFLRDGFIMGCREMFGLLTIAIEELPEEEKGLKIESLRKQIESVFDSELKLVYPKEIIMVDDSFSFISSD